MNLKVSVLVVYVVGNIFISSLGYTAPNRWIHETESSALTKILRDDIRDRIYVADSGNKKIVVIDSQTEKVIKTIPLPSFIDDMAISRDSTYLLVASNGRLFRMNLNNLTQVKKYTLALGKVISVAFDAQNDLFVLSSPPPKGKQPDTQYWIYHIGIDELKDLKMINNFGVGPKLSETIYSGSIKTDPTGTVLYVGVKGLSPLYFYKIDVSQRAQPKLIKENEWSSLGENLSDFVLSPRYNKVYLAAVGRVYGVEVVDMDSLNAINFLSMGNHVSGVAVTRQGDRIIATKADPYDPQSLFVFDAKSESMPKIYELLSETRNGIPIDQGVAVERFGEKVFILHGDTAGPIKVQVVDL